MSRRKTVLILCLLCMVLSSCSNTHDVVEETAAPTLQVMETEDTVTFTPITEPTAIAEAPAEPEPVAERISKV